MKLSILCVLLLTGFCNTNHLDENPSQTEPEWNGLRVTYGLFTRMPRTQAEAEARGFSLISNECNDPNSKFLGKRYWKNNDAAIVLIYDTNGYIAGMQCGVPDNLRNGYPDEPLRPNPYVADRGYYFSTVYFVDPEIICEGRNSGDYERDGSGSDFYIQNGTDPLLNSTQIPRTESDLTDGTKWRFTTCVASMGNHYFYNYGRFSNCDSLYPVFLMYNRGRLNGFGWVLKAYVRSLRTEHPPKPIYHVFLKRVPLCLYLDGLTSAIHVYLTDSPFANWC